MAARRSTVLAIVEHAQRGLKDSFLVTTTPFGVIMTNLIEQRRSRFQRTPTGKRICFTDRDAEILRLLYRYRFLRSTHLVQFVKPKSQKRFIERLGDLYHEAGLIDRPKGQWRDFNARYNPIVYEMSDRGRKWLEGQSALPDRVTSLARRNRPGATPQFEHAIMIVDALANVELETIANDHQRFVSVDEILSRAPDTIGLAKKPLSITVTLLPNDLPTLRARTEINIVPDGLYGIEYQSEGKPRYEFFALECEHTSPRRRSTPHYSSTELKEAAYRALIKAKQHRRVWGIPNLTLNVVSDR